MFSSNRIFNTRLNYNLCKLFRYTVETDIIKIQVCWTMGFYKIALDVKLKNCHRTEFNTRLNYNLCKLFRYTVETDIIKIQVCWTMGFYKIALDVKLKKLSQNL